MCNLNWSLEARVYDGRISNIDIFLHAKAVLICEFVHQLFLKIWLKTDILHSYSLLFLIRKNRF